MSVELVEEPLASTDDDVVPYARPETRDESAATRGWCGRIGRVVLTLVAFVVFGNVAILAATLGLQWAASPPPAPDVDIANFRVVDDDLWRGAAPGHRGLRELADAGATTIVDLRAEHDIDVDAALVDELGLTRHHLPIRDGQLPSEDQTAELLTIVAASDGPVFLHCGAGVGRTGAMTAFYLNTTDQADGLEALRHNLSVGPPSLEQIAFSVTSDSGYDHPGTGVTVVSRVLDAPRRIWHNIN